MSDIQDDLTQRDTHKMEAQDAHLSDQHIDTQSGKDDYDQAKGFGRAFWLTLITLLIIVGSLELYAMLRLDETLKEWTESPPSSTSVESRVDDTATQLAQGQREWRSKLIRDSFAAAQEEYLELGKEMKTKARRELKETRSALMEQIPAWADWYYSVIGEYIRLGHLGAHAAGQGDFDDYIVDQLSERVFKPAKVSERLAIINKQSKDLFAERHQSIIAHLSRTLQHHQESGVGWSGDDKEKFESRFKSLGDLNQLATVSPLGLAAKLTTLTGLKVGLKAIAARSAAKLGSVGIAKGAAAVGIKAGGKLGVKAGVRGGSVLASGASATAMCSPLGLAAPVCGIAAAAVTWVAVDKAIVEIDELINRDEFETRLRIELEGLMDELEHDVLKGLDTYQKQILDTLLKSENQRLDAPPTKTRLIDQLAPPPSTPSQQP
jgi:hypothetical protein